MNNARTKVLSIAGGFWGFIVGAPLGGFVGFLLRPSHLLVGQLPFDVVISRGANLKGLAEISAEIKDLAGKAKAKKLQPEEYTGATFSISNLGMMGIKEFTAIINPPEAAIIAVGGANPTAVVRDGQIVVRNIMGVTMSCDHRVVDGATGAKFLQTFKQMLETPAMMLV